MAGPGPGDDTLARDFEEHRGRLTAVAVRMLGSRADAEDAVQEAWLRLARQDAGAIGNLGAWLTTVVGRVCIDMLRSRRVHPEEPYGDLLPEIEVTEDDGPAPEEDALLADSVGVALLVVLDTLGPAERLAFVLHDLFAVPFDEVGQILGRSPDAAKMLASRARRKVHGTHGPADGRRRQRAVVDAFLAAARAGDFEGLLKVLDPDVTWRSYSVRGLAVRLGADEVATRAQRGVRAVVNSRPVLVNGEPGILVLGPRGRVIGLMACTVAGGRIVAVLSVSDPARLAALSLPPV
ncbi:MAG: sigma-70 family RNA polymerase sigma factor [Streptomyces sp.]|nr:sigma-70 family RNA polymerase sigma factor [Streptomyces sp.]